MLVIDNGPGVPARDREAVFELGFTRENPVVEGSDCIYPGRFSTELAIVSNSIRQARI